MICINCGGKLRFDIEKQKLVCDHCANTYDPDEFKDENINAEEYKYDVTYYMCPNCGGELYTVDDTAVTFCSFCGSTVALESRIEKENRPDAIIPFKVTKDDCTKAYKRLVRTSLFAPSSLIRDTKIERFRGIYMPYHIYSLRKKGKVSANGKTQKRVGDYIYKYSHTASADVDYELSGISFDASKEFSDSLSEAIAPFPIEKTVDFNKSYIAGFYADSSSVDSKVYVEDAERIAENDLANKLYRSSKDYLLNNISVSDIEKNVYCKPEHTSGLFPVWFLANTNRKGDRISYAVVNGVTGKIAAELPISFFKYLIGSLVLAVPLYLFFNSYLTITPKQLLLISCIFSIIAIVICDSQLNMIYTKDNYLDDKGRGILARNVSFVLRNKQFFLRFMWMLIKMALAAIGCFVAFILLTFLIFTVFDGLDTLAIILFFALFAASGYFGLIFIGSIMSNQNFGESQRYIVAPFKDKVWYYLKPSLAILVAVVTFFISPVYDHYYYAAIIFCMVMIVLAFFDIISVYNKLTMRKLPQFEIRGGERYE